MEKIKFYLEKYKIYILIFIICFIMLGIFLFIVFDKGKPTIEKEIVIEEKKEAKVEVNKIKVDVKGYVKNEGVYELNNNDRVIDQTTPNMIQKLILLFARKPLISKKI